MSTDNMQEIRKAPVTSMHSLGGFAVDAHEAIVIPPYAGSCELRAAAAPTVYVTITCHRQWSINDQGNDGNEMVYYWLSIERTPKIWWISKNTPGSWRNAFVDLGTSFDQLKMELYDLCEVDELAFCRRLPMYICHTDSIRFPWKELLFREENDLIDDHSRPLGFRVEKSKISRHAFLRVHGEGEIV